MTQLVLISLVKIAVVVAGIMLSGLMLSVKHFSLLASMSTVFSPTLITAFIVKNLLFGFMIAATACYHGMRVGNSPTEVPQQAQRAIVNSLIMLFILDGLFGLALLS